MKTSTIGNIRVKSANESKNVHNLSRNVYTSCSFGEVQPAQMMLCKADSKTNLKNEFLCYLADVNAPTYGHVNVNFWHYFVAFEDLFEIYPRLMAQTRMHNNMAVNPLVDKHIPLVLPHISRNVLSMLLLVGAHCTVYEVAATPSGNSRAISYKPFRVNDSAQNTAAGNTLSKFQTSVKNWFADTHAWYDGTTMFNPYGAIRTSGSSSFPFGVSSLHLDIRVLIDCPDLDNIEASMYIPFSNPTSHSLFEEQDENGATILNLEGVDIAPVDLNAADFVIERNFATAAHPNGGRYIFAFRMHAFGKRMFKIFKGCEFQEDFSSYKYESIAPFLALFKAYWCSFGLEQYNNYDLTYGGIICKQFDASAGADCLNYNAMFAQYRSDLPTWTPTTEQEFAVNYGAGFFFSLGQLWVTDTQDYVSAHQRSIAIAPSFDQAFVSSFTPVARANDNPITVPFTEGLENSGYSQFGENSHAYINNTLHGQLSAEVLQKLYKITNIETLAGKRIADLLRAQGYGKWMDHQKCAFIGHDVKQVEFSQVISTANTENNGNGDLVGGRGGRGEAYQQCKPHFYSNDKPGLLFTLCAVMPDAGYTQKMNPAFDCIKKWDFYTREFDGKGMEATPISYVNGERPVKLLNDDGSEPHGDTDRVFGFVPRMSKFKQVGNILSGHFAQRSTRDYYLTYNTDKFIDVGEISKPSDGYNVVNGVQLREALIIQVFPFSEFPLAGQHWRFPTRYPWLGHFARIFAQVGDNVNAQRSLIQSVSMLRQGWEFLNNEEDGFSIMCTLSVRQRSDMLQMADSYETTDDSNEGKTDMNLGGKA